jgi:cytochrome d ubiquinol oxidase subunit I
LCYGVVFAAGIYYINRLIAKGPRGLDTQSAGGFSASPMQAAQDAGRNALHKG